MPTLNYLDFSILTLVLSGVNKSTTICDYDTANVATRIHLTFQ
jgi:hypothetical protein